MKKKFCLFLITILTCTALFAEDWNYTGTSCDITASSAPIKIVNNTLQYVRIRGTPGAIKPKSSGAVHSRSFVLETNEKVIFSASGSTIYVNSVNSSGSNNRVAPADNHVDVHCIPCHGSGKCPKCDGKGYYYKSGVNHGKYKCDRCGGDGKCKYCNGKGRK
ncbi:MAG: hypothetical protein J1E59_05145 [Treponema sp.]|nr:hypothetical protein [Treponema sp.]